MVDLTTSRRVSTRNQCGCGRHPRLGDPTKVHLDARSPEEFRGEDVRAKYRGHIPGAVNIDWRENFANITMLKDPVILKTLYESKGVPQNKEVIVHCQTGQCSSVGSVAKFDFWGKIQKLDVRNSMA